MAAYDQARPWWTRRARAIWPTSMRALDALRRTRSGSHGTRPSPPEASGDRRCTTVNTGGQTVTTYSVGASADWTLDIWGQIRRTVESDRASAQASAAALAAARLSAQTTLATDYFELRAQDQLQKLLDDTVVAEQLSLKITESRYRFGVAAKADVVSARGATALEPGAADQCEDSARAARTRHCRLDRAAAGGILLEPHGDENRRADRARGSALDASGAAARTWPRPSAKWRRPMPRSASQQPPTFRA